MLYETTVDHPPLVPINLLGNRNVMAANLGVALAGFSLFLMAQALTYLLESPKPLGYDLSILDAGIMMIPMAIVQMITAPPIAGRVITSIGARRLTVIGSSIAIIGLLMLTYTSFYGLSYVIGSMSVLSAGISMVNVAVINILVFSVGRRNMGLATGLNSVFRNIGGVWGACGGWFINEYVPGLGAYLTEAPILDNTTCQVLLPINVHDNHGSLHNGHSGHCDTDT